MDFNKRRNLKFIANHKFFSQIDLNLALGFSSTSNQVIAIFLLCTKLFADITWKAFSFFKGGTNMVQAAWCSLEVKPLWYRVLVGGDILATGMKPEQTCWLAWCIAAGLTGLGDGLPPWAGWGCCITLLWFCPWGVWERGGVVCCWLWGCCWWDCWWGWWCWYWTVGFWWCWGWGWVNWWYGVGIWVGVCCEMGMFPECWKLFIPAAVKRKKKNIPKSLESWTYNNR